MPEFDRDRFIAALQPSAGFTPAQVAALADALAQSLSDPPTPAAPLRGTISDLA